MWTRATRQAAWTVLALVMASPLLRAADPVPPIKLTLKEIHCQGCAKRLATRLLTVQGVAAVETDVKAATATVKPKPEKVPSPRDLWDATLKAGFKPVKLQTPTATYTSRPAA